MFICYMDVQLCSYVIWMFSYVHILYGCSVMFIYYMDVQLCSYIIWMFSYVQLGKEVKAHSLFKMTRRSLS